MKKFKAIWLAAGLAFSLYLSLPGPKLPPPALPQSAQSDLPGDTWQLKNVSASYTNAGRKTALAFYTGYFSHSSFLGIPLPAYRINYPPEKARQVFKPTKRSYYLEEIVHPFRESLFVNGFEWEKDVFTPAAARPKNILEFAGRTWKSKVSLRWFYSPLLARLSLFWSSWGLAYIAIYFWKKEVAGLAALFQKKFKGEIKWPGFK